MLRELSLTILLNTEDPMALRRNTNTDLHYSRRTIIKSKGTTAKNLFTLLELMECKTSASRNTETSLDTSTLLMKLKETMKIWKIPIVIQSTGEMKVLLLESKIKDLADLAGPSQPLVLLKVWTRLPMEN